MGELGHCMDQSGFTHRALPLLQESIALLKSKPLPKNPRWAEPVAATLTNIADIMRLGGRFEEAAAALQEAIEVQCVARLRPPDLRPYLALTKVCIDMGQFERDVEMGREAERMWEARDASPDGTISLRYPMYVCAHLATAYEGIGNNWEMLQYQNRAMDMIERSGSHDADVLTVFERKARLLVAVGRVSKAEELLDGMALDGYKKQLELPDAGLGLASTGFRCMILALQRLVEIRRLLGKEEEARALELDLDETEAILASKSVAALNELRDEIQEETGAGMGAERRQQGSKKKKGKLTRKQQKRKAAQRRRAAEAAEQQAEAAAAAGRDAGDDDVDGVTAAIVQLQIDDAAPAAEQQDEQDDAAEEDEPEPEPEECAICLNDLPLPGEEGAVLLVCTHAFHTGCLERCKAKCLEKGLAYTCAMCRGTVVVAAAGGEA